MTNTDYKLNMLKQQLKQVKGRVAYYNRLRGFRSCELSKQCVNINADQMRKLSHDIDLVVSLKRRIKELKDDNKYAKSNTVIGLYL